MQASGSVDGRDNPADVRGGLSLPPAPSPSHVMAGLVPAIHAERPLPTPKNNRDSNLRRQQRRTACGRTLRVRSEMAGTSPAVTVAWGGG